MSLGREWWQHPKKYQWQVNCFGYATYQPQYPWTVALDFAQKMLNWTIFCKCWFDFNYDTPNILQNIIFALFSALLSILKLKKSFICLCVFFSYWIFWSCFFFLVKYWFWHRWILLTFVQYSLLCYCLFDKWAGCLLSVFFLLSL